MHIEEWSGPRVAAVLASLRDEGFSESRLARMAGVNRSQVNRWGRGENRPGYDPARRLAASVWGRRPDLARELIEASGYAWSEPQAVPEPKPELDDDQELLETLRRVYRDDPDGPEKIRAVLRKVAASEASGQPRSA